MLEAGLSPNACDDIGESILHLICRHDKVDLFRVLLAFGVDLQQTDEYGRTAMHSACWASNPSFEITRCLLKRDPNFLFFHDERGMHPLNYITKANWGLWEDFLEKHVDEFYPEDNPDKNRTPPLCSLPANSRPVPDPEDVVDATLVNMVASGALTAIDAIIDLEADDETTVSCSEIDPDETTYYDSSDEDESETCFDDTESEIDSEEEEELLEMIERMGHLGRLRYMEERDC